MVFFQWVISTLLWVLFSCPATSAISHLPHLLLILQYGFSTFSCVHIPAPLPHFQNPFVRRYHVIALYSSTRSLPKLLSWQLPWLLLFTPYFMFSFKLSTVHGRAIQLKYTKHLLRLQTPSSHTSVPCWLLWPLCHPKLFWFWCIVKNHQYGTHSKECFQTWMPIVMGSSRVPKQSSCYTQFKSIEGDIFPGPKCLLSKI